MSDSELLKLAEREPAIAETVTRALGDVVDFHKTRGALLRTYNNPAPSHEDI